jgi:dynein heavy chain
MQTKQTNP